MIAIIMPQVGQDIPTAKVVEWLKQENDPVEKGEVVVIVESEKASFEVEAEQSGVLLKILHEAGEEVEVFKPLAYIGQPGESVPEEGVEEAGEKPDQAATAPSPSSAQSTSTAAPDSDRIAASPAARRVAREHGVDLRTVKGTGPGNRITKADVLAAVSSGAPALITPLPPEDVAGARQEDTVVPFGKLRAEMARRLTLSKQTIPHFYLFADVDMTAAGQWRESFNREHGTRITITDLVIKATAGALREFGRINAHVEQDKLIVRGVIHIGVAVAVDDGLLVPVIPDADQASIRDLSDYCRKIAQDAKQGKLNPNVVGTFTVTSLGMYGVQMFLPVVNPPECAILAVGAVEKRVIPVEQDIAVRDMMTLTLACDHRAVDGTYGGQFLNHIKHLLESEYAVEGK